VKKNILCQFEEEAMRTPMAPKLKLLDTKFINKPQPQRIRDRFIKLKKKDRKPTTMTTMTAAHHT
jgi:hypothetical protein